MITTVQPLSGPSPAEVPLSHAPLVQVVAQVRFPQILAIGRPDKVVDFQEAIRGTYPNLAEERVPHVDFVANGLPSVREAVVWRFDGGSKSPRWRVSLGIDFVSLETSAYVSRRDFLDRLGVVLDSLQHVFKPSDAQRLGLRYVDRIVDDGLERIHRLIKANVLGISMPAKGAESLSLAIHHMLTEAHLQAEDGFIQARWGHLAAGMTYDPNALPPLDKSSWVLDLDMFTTASQPFDSKELLLRATSFAERNYSVFRDMVTDEFLAFYGAKL